MKGWRGKEERKSRYDGVNCTIQESAASSRMVGGVG
jgi:hypothetical protein